MRVKIFKQFTPEYIENDINKWLLENKNKISLCDYLQSENKITGITVSIFYEEIKGEK